MFAGEGRFDQAVHEPVRRLAQEHRARFRERLQAGRDVDRVSQHRESSPSVCKQLSDNRRSYVDPDPHLRSDTVFVFNDSPRGPKSLQYLERRAAGAKRRILDRNRRAKGNHQPIAGYVMDVRALNLDDTFNNLRKTLNKAERRLFAESLGERGKANHIREENDDLPALRFQAITPSPRGAQNIQR